MYIILPLEKIAEVLSLMGSTISILLLSQPNKFYYDDVEMLDVPKTLVTKLKKTLRVKLPNMFISDYKILKVFLLQAELYQYFNDNNFPIVDSYCIQITYTFKAKLCIGLNCFFRITSNTKTFAGVCLRKKLCLVLKIGLNAKYIVHLAILIK